MSWELTEIAKKYFWENSVLCDDRSRQKETGNALLNAPGRKISAEENNSSPQNALRSFLFMPPVHMHPLFKKYILAGKLLIHWSERDKRKRNNLFR